MKYFKELVSDNNDKIVAYNDTTINKLYVSVFDYSVKYGGSFDSHKYYNNFVVEVGCK